LQQLKITQGQEECGGNVKYKNNFDCKSQGKKILEISTNK